MAGNEKHPGMMGDGTEEQSLGQTGNPGARITKDEAEAAFKERPTPEVGGSGNIPGAPGSGMADDKPAAGGEAGKDTTHGSV